MTLETWIERSQARNHAYNLEQRYYLRFGIPVDFASEQFILDYETINGPNFWEKDTDFIRHIITDLYIKISAEPKSKSPWQR